MTETYSSLDIAAELDRSHAGPVTRVSGIDSLDRATETDLAFCVYEDPRIVADSRAGALVCPPDLDRPDDATCIYAENPKLTFIRAVEAFFGAETEQSVHETAVVEDGATIGESCTLGPHTYVADCVTIGDDVTVRAGTTIGTDGFGFVRDADSELQRLPHQGRIHIEDGVEIGANCTIDRAVFEETVVGAGTKLSANVHLAHHVRLGADATVACHCGIAGGATVGDRVTVHPHVSIANDVTVSDDAEVAMNAAVLDDVARAATVAGSPARRID